VKPKHNTTKPPYTGEDVAFATLLMAGRIYRQVCNVERIAFKLGPKGWDLDVTYKRAKKAKGKGDV
jgi:hypothetical protein